MRVLSVNIGQPTLVEWAGKTFTTSIFKQPVAGPVALAALHLAGDQQADLKVHGGPHKAVYAYDAAHYAYWRQQLARPDWPPGLFGENLTTEGLPDAVVRVGDLFGIGTARLRAVQPRQPCYKLNARFDDAGMAARFTQAGRAGIYFRVEAPGTVQAGDAIELLEAAATDITIEVLAQLSFGPSPDAALLAAAAALPHLPPSVRARLSRRQG